MKVYVLLGGWDYEGQEVCAVFRHKDTARLAARSRNRNKKYGHHDGYAVDEFEIDNSRAAQLVERKGESNG